jgi:hypothetical protein
MEEIWNEIPSYPNYQASNLGNIRRKLNERLLKTKSIDNRPYQVITIFTNGKKYTKKVARLVWEAFNGCECDKTIDHIDRNALNNHIDNLRCISIKENCMNKSNTPKSNKYNLTDEIKRDIINAVKNGNKTSWDIMKQYGLPLNYITTVIKRKSWDKYLDQ